jgi:F-type H+-transporting ATPase subunit b
MNMAPNWPQLITTAIGFLILVGIMKKYAWGPILDMLDARRDKIENDYAAAEKELSEAETLKSDFEGKLGEIAVIQREKVQEAVKKGEELRDGIVAKARGEMDEAREKGMQALEIETRKAELQLRDDVADLAIGAAEKLIGERLDDAKHRQLIQQYIDQLGSGSNA